MVYMVTFHSYVGKQWRVDDARISAGALRFGQISNVDTRKKENDKQHISRKNNDDFTKTKNN
jgi:hypothetical protein